MEQLGTDWRKSSFSSGSNNGSCVEAGQASDAILVRDTTDRAGFTLPVVPGAWTSFLGQVKNRNLPL